MFRKIFLLGFVAAAFLAGCSDGGKPVAPPAAANAPASEPPASTAAEPAATDTSKGLIRSDVTQMTGCDPVVAQISWDVSKSNPPIDSVEIYTGSEANNTLFAAGGNVGTQATGQWTSPGAIFILKDKSTGVELDRLQVQGPDCSK